MRSSTSEFNRKITVQHFESRRDDYGNETGEWVEFHKCSAGVITNGGDAAMEENRPDYNSVVEFKVRYCYKAFQIVPETYRIIFGNVVYRILSAVDVNAAHQIIKIKAVIDSGTTRQTQNPSDRV